MEIIREAYALFRKQTPLKGDCGKLCGSRCCGEEKGISDGMWLFPGEDALFQGMEEEGFTVRSTPDNEGYPLVVCSGTCKREHRPLACRIYPLFPIVDGEPGKERIRLIYDPRGNWSCPLAAGKVKLSFTFRRAVRRTARLLLRDPQCADYLRKTGAFLEEIAQFQNRMEK